MNDLRTMVRNTFILAVVIALSVALGRLIAG